LCKIALSEIPSDSVASTIFDALQLKPRSGAREGADGARRMEAVLAPYISRATCQRDDQLPMRTEGESLFGDCLMTDDFDIDLCECMTTGDAGSWGKISCCLSSVAADRSHAHRVLD
jgi:hypothetical protein